MNKFFKVVALIAIGFCCGVPVGLWLQETQSNSECYLAEQRVQAAEKKAAAAEQRAAKADGYRRQLDEIIKMAK